MDFALSFFLYGLVCLLAGFIAFYFYKRGADLEEPRNYLFPVGVFLVALALFSFANMLVSVIEYGNEPPCEWLLNESDSIYIYGDNYSGEHWTYSDAPAGPPNVDDPINVFHYNETNYYYNSCADRATPATIKAAFTIHVWLIWLTLFTVALAFFVYLFRFFRRLV